MCGSLCYRYNREERWIFIFWSLKGQKIQKSTPMCPMKIKIKIANFSRVVKLIFGPLKKQPRHYARVFFHSGSCHTSLEQARRVQHKPNRNICPLIGILNGYGQNGHFGLKSSPLVIKCLIPLLLCNTNVF